MNESVTLLSVLRAVFRLVRRPLPWVMVALAGVAFTTPTAHAAVRNVGSGQPYATIDAALAASSDGDVINVVDPVHTEADIYVSDAGLVFFDAFEGANTWMWSSSYP